MMLPNLRISALHYKMCFIQPRRVKIIWPLSCFDSQRLQSLSAIHPCMIQSRAIRMSRLSSNKTVTLLESSGALSGGMNWNKTTHPHSSFNPFVVQSRRSVSSISDILDRLADNSVVHLTEQLLVWTQQSSGLPWWGSIICTTVALRFLITFPFAIYQAYIIAKNEDLQKEIEAMSQRLRYEVYVRAKQKSWDEETCRSKFDLNMRRLVSELYIRENCHPFKAILIIWVQLPLWIFMSLALRNLSFGTEQAPPNPGLSVEGTLWIPDLTLPDTTWIIPIGIGLINLLIIEIIALKRQEIPKRLKYLTHFIRGVSVMMIPIAANVPSCVCLYWLSSCCVGLSHQLLIKSPRFRSFCRIPAIPSDSKTPYRDLAQGLKNKFTQKM
ncbi:hypothetical protein DNTS_020389 [Danionella cerebrum]|uniref:Membrane insertase YidC/Oxa/ALB C-terminal domain-containing protein n=1 Tax=Danionella cerebrum TaxID=2873325 RepID=A0A553QMZ3_9TELE|nr:hypothetical protein DNTS_020389 [Danionella translucida]